MTDEVRITHYVAHRQQPSEHQLFKVTQIKGCGQCPRCVQHPRHCCDAMQRPCRHVETRCLRPQFLCRAINRASNTRSSDVHTDVAISSARSPINVPLDIYWRGPSWSGISEAPFFNFFFDFLADEVTVSGYTSPSQYRFRNRDAGPEAVVLTQAFRGISSPQKPVYQREVLYLQTMVLS